MQLSHHNRRILGCALFAFAIYWLTIGIAAAQRITPLVIQGGTLIDATGRDPIEDAVIVVEGERIKTAGKRGEVPIPRGAKIIDAKGKTILPGFIDGHCHLLDFMGELYLHLGITTFPDSTNNDDEWTLAQRNGTNLGKIRGPRIWSTGGGADYAISAALLKNRRDDAKKYMSGICQGIAIARNDRAKALGYIAKTGRNIDAAGIEYLYKLYMSDVIPAKPFLKSEGVDLAIQMTAAIIPSAATMNPQELADDALMPELEKEGRCKF